MDCLLGYSEQNTCNFMLGITYFEIIVPVSVVMEESLEDRLLAIEKVLGIDEYSSAKKADFDVASLQEKMTDLGLERVMKIPLSKLKKLKSITSRPQAQPLSEQLATIEFCENLIRQRAELLKEFEERLQVVLNAEKIGSVAQQEAQLDGIQSDIQKGLDEWKQYTLDLENFKTEYFSVIAALQERLEELEKAVAAVERESEA
ncbi:unnamed protein product [Cylicocyclus nassatus]|uniref:Uncharacterized protein n=1 Tax=Cylicocyclus nassatus TaxID=53992 RepID=A0AA36MFV0_CYLNA|nr:unnamed protein product [Cylicocyclus nassatus]